MTERAGPYAQTEADANRGDAALEGTRLPHLAGPAAELRQVLAAHALRDCAHIVEIGGAGLPITGFLTHRPLSVTVIDPKIPDHEALTLNGAPCRVRHVRAKLQQAPPSPPEGRLGLVLLGLSLKPFGSGEAVDETLLGLIRRAEVMVIDHALALDRALGQIGPILAARGGAPLIDLELRINDAALAAAGYDRRRFLVFSR